MKQDKWTQQLHDKLAEHQTVAPEGLWSDIEAALNAQPKARKSRFVALRRWAVAASIAALVGGGVYWGMFQSPSKEDVSQAEASQPHAGKKEQPSIVPSDDNEISTTPLRRNEGISVLPVQRLREEMAEQIAALDTTGIQTTKAEDVIPQPPSEEHHDVSDPQPSTGAHDVARPQYPNMGLSSVPRRGSTGGLGSLSLKLYASNGLVSYMGRNGVLMDDALASNYTSTYHAGETRGSMPIYLAGYEERQHHYQPLSFGLSVNYPLTSRLAVSAGVNYTWMRSDFTQIIQTQTISQEQKLHYIGIPVSVSYRLWSYKGLRVYASAGVEADWNVKTHLQTEGVTQPLDHDRMQWSVRGSLGVEYYIIPQLGLYVEPGAAYYFDNGSYIQNYWKDKPTSLNLQMGIRFNLSRQGGQE